MSPVSSKNIHRGPENKKGLENKKALNFQGQAEVGDARKSSKKVCLAV
jgi:hypothetical protein